MPESLNAERANSPCVGRILSGAAPPRWAVLSLLALMVAAAAFRTVPAWKLVFPQAGEVRLKEVDPYFHVRHAQFVARHFPHLQRWDVGTEFPHGERGINQGGFDYLVGGLALLAGGGRPTDALIQQVAAVTPVLLFCLVLLALYDLARLFLPPGACILACALLVAVPGPLLGYSELGDADHHVAEVLLALLTCSGLVRCCGNPHPITRPGVWHALPLTLFLFTWPGAPLYLLLAGAAVVAAMLASCLRREFEPIPALARASARYGAGVAVTYLPLSWLCPDLVMWWIGHSYILLGLGAVIVVVPATVALVERARSWNRPAQILLAATLLTAAAWYSRSATVQWMLGQLLDARSSVVAEQQKVTARMFGDYYGVLAVLAPLSAAIVAFWIVRRRAPLAAVIPLFFGVSLLALWWRTWDFMYAPPAFLALISAAVLYYACQRRGFALAAAAALLAPMWPAHVTYPPWVQPAQVASDIMVNDDWFAAMRWMREHTPQPSVPVDALVKPWGSDGFPYPPDTYGVYTAWEYGDFISFLGRRSAVHSESTDKDLAAWLFLQDEAAAATALQRRTRDGQRVRYLVFDSRMLSDILFTEAEIAELAESLLQEGDSIVVSGGTVRLPQFNDRFRQSMAARLYLEDARNLAHFRLVYETPGQRFLAFCVTASTRPGDVQIRPQSFPLENPADALMFRKMAEGLGSAQTRHGYLYDGKMAATVKIFEAVAGARLHGVARANRMVEATLPLMSLTSRRTFAYRQAVQAGPHGDFTLTVPYPTDSFASDVVAQGPYRISDGRGASPAKVTESEVQQGALLNLGTLP